MPGAVVAVPVPPELAAHPVSRIQQHHVQPGPGGRGGGREASRTGTDHRDVIALLAKRLAIAGGAGQNGSGVDRLARTDAALDSADRLSGTGIARTDAALDSADRLSGTGIARTGADLG